MLLLVVTGPTRSQLTFCSTTGGTACNIPFIYQNELRTGCITDNDPDSKLWCSTATNETNHHLTGNWGHCEEGCPVHGSCTTSLGGSGICMSATQCIGVNLDYLQSNICGDEKVCCEENRVNAKVEFPAASKPVQNFMSSSDDSLIESIINEVEQDLVIEKAEGDIFDDDVGLRFGAGVGGGDPQEERTPSSLHHKFTMAGRDAVNFDQTSTVFLRLNEKLAQNEVSGGIGLRSDLSGFTSRAVNKKCPWLPTPNCDNQGRFRSHDGTCNNLKEPNFGRMGTPFNRIMLPEYAGGSTNLPRKRPADGFELPSARRISSQLTTGSNNADSTNTLMTMQFGQFLDHDITHTPAHGVRCCTRVNKESKFPGRFSSEKCFPIRIDQGDRFFKGKKKECMEFSRSLSSPDLSCNVKHREQLNQITHWLDGSNIYSSSDKENKDLRETSGMLRVGRLGPTGRPGLPVCTRSIASQKIDACRSCSSSSKHCVFAGDFRVNEQPNLVVMHTLFVRQHNRLVQILRGINPSWNGERLYQEARRINVAMYQHITYKEWLPIVLGNTMMKTFGLNSLSSGYSTDYDDGFDPRINNEFAAAAFRFGHSLIPSTVMVMPNEGPTQFFKLKETFFNPPTNKLNLTMNLDGFVRGMAEEEGMAWDENFISDVRDHLFEANESEGGLDLVALNIQRGRDHGIPGYIKYLEICGQTKIKKWNDLSKFMRSENIAKLQRLYQDVEDIDLFVGGFMEAVHLDSMIGPVFKCIIGDQFARLKKGDRFFYDLSPNLPSVKSAFTIAQLNEIRKISMSRLICTNTDIGDIQPFAFQLPLNQVNSKRSCGEILQNRVDWNVFKE